MIDQKIYYVKTDVIHNVFTMRVRYKILLYSQTTEKDYHIRFLDTDDKDKDKAKEIVQNHVKSLRVRGACWAVFSDVELEPLSEVEPWSGEKGEKIERGTIPFGKYVDFSFDDVYKTDENYLSFIRSDKFQPTNSVGIYLAEAVSVFLNEKELEKGFKMDPETNNEWIGTVGERTVFKGTVTNNIEVEGRYGTNRIITFMQKETGYEICYKGSAMSREGGGPLEKEDRVIFQATIKRHTEYRKKKQTEVRHPLINIVFEVPKEEGDVEDY